MPIKKIIALSLVLNALLVIAVISTGGTRAQNTTTVEGDLFVAMGDTFDGDLIYDFSLTLDDGTVLDLDMDEETFVAGGGVLALFNQRVAVTTGDNPTRSDTLSVEAIAYAGQARDVNTPQAVSGAQPWLSIMCEFPGDASGTSDTSGTVAYFQDMYASAFPGLDHYWQELSFGEITVAGSGVSSNGGAWHQMPNPQSSYMSNGSPNLDLIAADCVEASGANLNNYVGVNLMLDEQFGCCAWGGSTAAVPGKRTTWNPPWAWQSITVIAHEMGHGFGLPHSNNNDGDNDPYDNPMDVMSGAYSGNVVDGTYGLLGQHTISYHKGALGWINEDSTYLVLPGTDTTINLDSLTNPVTTGDYHTIIIEGEGTTFYTVEARSLDGYDAELVGEAVTVYEVNPFRIEPAWLIDCTSGIDDNCTDAQMGVGDSWTTPAGDVTITVAGTTADGFQIGIVATAEEGSITLQATSQGQTSASLLWNDIDTETGYRIEYADTQGALWSTLATVNANVTTYTDNSLTCGSGRLYRVVGFNGGGDITTSNSAPVTTDDCTNNPGELVNGDFEQGTTGWIFVTSGGSLDTVVPYPAAFSGNNLAAFSTNGDIEGIIQNVTDVNGAVGDSISVTFYVGGANLAADGLVATRIITRSGGVNQDVYVCTDASDPLNGSFTWVALTCTLPNATAAYDSLNIAIGSLNHSSGIMALDAVSYGINLTAVEE